MLVLNRKIGQRIHITGGIWLTVLDFDRRGQVRLGIDAPPGVKIHREELLAAATLAGEEVPGGDR